MHLGAHRQERIDPETKFSSASECHIDVRKINWPDQKHFLVSTEDLFYIC